MSLAAHFLRPAAAHRADRKDPAGLPDTGRRYRSVTEYDPVLLSHCGLAGETALSLAERIGKNAMEPQKSLKTLKE